MYVIALAALSCFLSSNLRKLTSDVTVIEQRSFRIPVNLDDERKDKIKELRVFFSEDRGKSWRHAGDFEPTADGAVFNATEDGLYWFALQVVFKDGTSEPADPKRLCVDTKVFVNTSGKPVAMQKSYAELLRENEELQKKVKELEKKLAVRQPGEKPR